MPRRIIARFTERLKPYRHVIWDWNGTILDDVHIAVDAIGEVAAKHNLPRPTVHQYRQYFGFPVADYYRHLGFDFSRVSLKEIADQFHAVYEQRVHQGTLFRGMFEILECLAQDKLQSILSAAAQEHLEAITARFGLHVHFTHIFGQSDNLAASKITRGHELMAAAGVAPAQTVLIGDTDHDLEVGRALGIDVMLIGDGHQQAERLLALHNNVLPSRFSEHPENSENSGNSERSRKFEN